MVKRASAGLDEISLLINADDAGPASRNVTRGPACAGCHIQYALTSLKVKMSGAVEPKKRTQKQKDCPGGLQCLHLRFGSDRIGAL